MLPLDVLSACTDDELVAALATSPRTRAAYRELLRRGGAALGAIRVGLRHAEARVRMACCELLDRLVVEEAMDELLAMLDDADARVRLAALHAVACDRCKDDGCAPSEAAALPPGIRLLEQDPDAHVRAMAVELVGRYVHVSEAAASSLSRAHHGDPSPAVRKKAGWYAPGGTIHRRSAPRSHPRARRPTRFACAPG